MGERGALASRRDWILGATAAAVLPDLLACGGAWANETNGWDEVVARLLNGAKPGQGKLQIDLPEIAENGNTVPFSVFLDSPMTEADHVKSITVLSTANPQPVVSTFLFTPLAGRAAVSGRLRLARTQQIVALGALSDGRFIMTRRDVKVTIGGCGG